MSEGDASFLAILFETSDSLVSALQQTCQLSARAFIEHLLIFIRSHALLNDANQLAVFGVGRGATTLLHATAGCLPSLAPHDAPGPAPVALDSAAGLLERLREAAARGAPAAAAPVAWSGALLRALCLISKLQVSTEAAAAVPAPRARILCLSATPDDPGQYLAVMNAVFAAQRAAVTVDACVLGDAHSAFMQQASFLTGGTYLRPSKPGALAQYLLTAYTADAASREFLRLPRASGVDFRASCFCHKRPTALGYVCSVCLSIFCEKVPACSTCGAAFPAGAAATRLPA